MFPVRGLTVALNGLGRYKYKTPDALVDYLVVGGGVVGLAIAQRLSSHFPEKMTFLVERHESAGEETSSRNSEVIHSGLYYAPDSLKTRLCIRGRELLYERCCANSLPHRKLGKLVVATNKVQHQYLRSLHHKAKLLSQQFHGKHPLHVPTQLISGDEARGMEPDLSPDVIAALWSPETGIVDSHALMESLERDIGNAESGQFVYSTEAVRIDSHPDAGWTVNTLINVAGLSAPLVLNAILPLEKRLPMYFARGSYASYHGPGVSNVKHLIYPCPAAAQAFHGLGTHLTLDMNGKIKFGPDVEWISPPSSSEDSVDFWKKYLVPDSTKLEEMHRAVTQYLPGVSIEGMEPDYVGIRPKIAPPGSGFQDFVIRLDADRSGKRPMLSLLGIESPGLTASLALAEHIVDNVLHVD
ncbi:FAD dependent oxidoreductase [Fistulina hepatica ATCC 64428]|uniref:L-2-hydroxyglutarate dehydrogenase, mitochondrial n=1 Tax=Fistulina hepatica ATCC 64428 TaxID=1128425 RepID=A0A0D7A7M7_9AGAR|nr:FAD dependent oxidoreductase [Fistulina hepatica ATCC 64428]